MSRHLSPAPACTFAEGAQDFRLSARLVEAGKGYSKTQVNTAIFRASSLVTQGGEQYISFYDPKGYVTLGKRKLGSTEWELNRTQHKGHVRDAHNVISIGIDGEGYLHASFGQHAQPLNYCRSTAPRSLELGALEPMLGQGEDDVTYPEFYSLAGGGLLFAYRSGYSGRGNLVLNRYCLNSRKWQRVHDVLIDGEGERNAYWQLYVDERGAIHLSWVWRESPDVATNHDLCYARSLDNGATWLKTDGAQYGLPIRLGNAEYACRIPQGHELINQTSMSADSSGNPYIASYWRDDGSAVPQYRLVWHDGERWQARQVLERKRPFSLSGGGTKMVPIARPRIVVDGEKIFYIFRDEERGSKVSIAYSPDMAKSPWRVCDLTDFAVDAWEPSLDAELWKRERKLHIFVQRARQGDGERAARLFRAQPVYVLEVGE